MKLLNGAELIQVISSKAPWAGLCWVSVKVMRCRYRSLRSDSSSRCCGFIKPRASSHWIDRKLFVSNPSGSSWPGGCGRHEFLEQTFDVSAKSSCA
jgi:hypothetical protein